jgi:MbtH protein
MFGDDREDTGTYRVVLNHEQQYSIWPAHKELPPGWMPDGTEGSKADCLAHIDRVWTDMRPASLRKLMDAAAAPPPAPTS